MSQVQVQRVMSIAEASSQLQAKSKEAGNNVIVQDESLKRFMIEKSNDKHNLLNVEANLSVLLVQVLIPLRGT